MKISLYCLLIVLTPCLAIAGGIKLLEASAISGDKIKGRSEQGVYFINLSGIDAPEKDQPFGDESTQSLQTAIDKGLPLLVMMTEACPAGMPCVASVFTKPGWSLSDLQVAEGMAWANGDADKYLSVKQKDAERKSVGLWSAENPIPPWGWRDKDAYYESKAMSAMTRAKIDARAAGKTYSIRDHRAEERSAEQRSAELAALNRMINREKSANDKQNRNDYDPHNEEAWKMDKPDIEPRLTGKFGTEYKYDLSDIGDAALYEMDTEAQRRDSLNSGVQSDRFIGINGGGAK